MEGWPVTGTLSWGRGKKDAPLDFRVALEASGLEGAEADGRSWTVKSLDTRVTARLDWDPFGREISGFWKQEFLKGSLAYNDWGFSFNESPLPLEFSGKMSYPPGEVPGSGSLEISASLFGVLDGFRRSGLGFANHPLPGAGHGNGHTASGKRLAAGGTG